MSRGVALACFLASLGFAQTITVQPTSIAGIEIIGPKAPNFGSTVAGVVGSDQPRDFLAWLPYAIVIKNTSKEPIAGLAVMWSCQRNASDEFRRCWVGVPEWFQAPNKQLLPGHAVVVMPGATLNDARRLKAFAGGTGMGNLPEFQQSHAIAISVDGIVTASGEFTGPDAAGAYEQWLASISAPRALATAVIEKRTTTPIADIVAWLQTTGAQRHTEDYNAAESASTARQLLATYTSRGEKQMYAMADSILEQPAFPLHR